MDTPSYTGFFKPHLSADTLTIPPKYFYESSVFIYKQEEQVFDLLKAVSADISISCCGHTEIIGLYHRPTLSVV
jgi:hypothetical protein